MAAGVRSVLAIVFVVAHFGAFLQNLRRYTVGHGGTLLVWREPEWSPPLSPLLLLVAYAVLLIALGGVALGWHAGPYVRARRHPGRSVTA